MEKGRLIEEHIEAFLGDGDKGKPQKLGHGSRRNPHIRLLPQDREAHLEVGEDLAVIALNLRGPDAHFLEMVVQEHAGAGTLLPVDESDLLFAEVFEPSKAQGVAGGGEKSKIAKKKVDDDRPLVRKKGGKKGNIIFTALGVQKCDQAISVYPWFKALRPSVLPTLAEKIKNSG